MDSLPTVTVQFKAVGEPLPISPEDVFLGYPVCSSNGITLLNVARHPNYADQFLVAVSPKSEVNTYPIAAAPGLTNTNVLSVDAAGSDVYALVIGQKLDALRDHNLDPTSADAKTASRFYRFFILHFAPDLASPDETPIDLPFDPMRLAVTDPEKITILGFDAASQGPVIAMVDHQGHLVQEIDPNGSFGNTRQIIAGLPRAQGNQAMPDESAQMQGTLSAGQWVHYGDSLLFLVPGPDARVVTLRSDGEIEGTRLRLPIGFQAQSLVTSDNEWFVRIVEGALTGNMNNRTMLVMAEPADGAILQIIRTPQLSPVNITCVRDGKSYAVQWTGEKDNLKPFLAVGSP